MQYRRAKNPGSSYFFNIVTHNRRPILCEPENIDLLRDSFKRVIDQHPFTIIKFVSSANIPSVQYFSAFISRGVNSIININNDSFQLCLSIFEDRFR